MLRNSCPILSEAQLDEPRSTEAARLLERPRVRSEGRSECSELGAQGSDSDRSRLPREHWRQRH